MAARVILLADDNPSDALLFAHVMARRAPDVQVQHAVSGQRAIDYLAGTDQFGDRGRFPLPAVVVLDVHMPNKSGFDVLQWIRGQEQFKSLPVIMLTTPGSTEEEGISMGLGATTYVPKTHDWAPLLDNVVFILERKG